MLLFGLLPVRLHILQDQFGSVPVEQQMKIVRSFPKFLAVGNSHPFYSKSEALLKFSEVTLSVRLTPTLAVSAFPQKNRIPKFSKKRSCASIFDSCYQTTPEIFIIFRGSNRSMAKIAYKKGKTKVPQDLSKVGLQRVIIYSQERNNKSKRMNFCIDIHYTTPDGPEKKKQSLNQGHQGKVMLQRKQRNSKKTRNKKTNFVWTVKEQRSYISFLKAESHLFRLTAKERKIVKINIKMGQRIKTRSAPQCHSHHQKMMGKYGTIEAIVSANNHLFIREKRQGIKEGVEQSYSSSEHEIAPWAIERKQPVDVNDSSQELKRPIWWQYMDLMLSPSSDELQHHPYGLDSACLDFD